MEMIELAGCVIQEPTGKILLIHRSTPKRSQWEIPGGKVDAGESAEAAAAREIKEELGVSVSITGELGQQLFDQDGYTMKYFWFAATINSGEPKIQEPATHDEWRYISLNEINEFAAELSPNCVNFVSAVREGRVLLNA